MTRKYVFAMIALIAPFGAYAAPQIASGEYVEQKIDQEIASRTMTVTADSDAETQEVYGVKKFAESPVVPDIEIEDDDETSSS